MKKRKYIIAGLAGMTVVAGVQLYRKVNNMVREYKYNSDRVKNLVHNSKDFPYIPDELIEDAIYKGCTHCDCFENPIGCLRAFNVDGICRAARELKEGHFDAEYLERKSGKSDLAIALKRMTDKNKSDYEDEGFFDEEDETEDDLEIFDLDEDGDSEEMPEPGKMVKDFSGKPVMDISPRDEENPFKNMTGSSLGDGYNPEENLTAEEKHPMFFNPIQGWDINRFKDPEAQRVEDKINNMMRSPKDVFPGVEELPSRDIAQIVLKLSQLAEYPDTLIIALENPENYVSLNFPNVDEKYKKYLVNFVKNLKSDD